MEQHLLVLRALYDALTASGANWALTGSLGLALQGVPLEPHDIDVQTDKEGAYALAEMFADDVIEPVAFSAVDHTRSYLGVLKIGGIKVEVMGDMQHRGPDGAWEPPVDLDAHKRFVEIEGMRVPVLSLEHEHTAYLKMGRAERAAQIAQVIEQSSKAK